MAITKLYKGRGLGEGEQIVGPGGRLADDGKRNEVQRNGDGRFVHVASRREGLKGRESEGGRVKNSSRCGGWRIFFRRPGVS